MTMKVSAKNKAGNADDPSKKTSSAYRDDTARTLTESSLDLDLSTSVDETKLFSSSSPTERASWQPPSSSVPPSLGNAHVRASWQPSSSAPAQTQSHFAKRMTKSEISQRLLNQGNIDLRKNKTVQEMTINKLRYDRVGFVGRDTETKTLQNCLERMCASKEEDNTSDTNGRKELVFIKGYSGTGKSKLAATLEKHELLQKKKNGLMVEGKFDFTHDVPYSGIAAAFGEICRTIKDTFGSRELPEKNGDSETVDCLTAIGQALLSEVGVREIQLLAKLVPELLDLIPTADLQQEVNESDDFEAGQERWKYSFRLLARVLNSYISPLILVLDDLQWADAPSLEVIDYLISDFQNLNPLMIIGCFRSNEVDDTHILSNKMEDLAGKKDQFKFNITDIELGSLKVDDVNKAVMALLNINDETKSQRLAEICFKRTLGNPFFLIEFVTMLKEEKLIEFNLGLLKWMWNDKAIEDETMSTANVVDLLQARMQKLPSDAQLLLRYAACLGASFVLSTLTLLWTEHAAREDSATDAAKPEDILSLLGILEEGNFIESCGGGSTSEYRLTHDKVKEAALSLDGFGDSVSAFQFEMGSILCHSFNDEELEESLFDVVDLINKSDTITSRNADFAKLNLRAAHKAKSISAFGSAATYVANGNNHLPSDKWMPLHRDLTLQLYTLGAQAEFALGQMDKMESYSDEVLSRSDCSTLDKFPFYLLKESKLSAVERNYKGGLKYALKVYEELDGKLAHSRSLLPFQAIGSLLKTIKRTQSTPQGATDRETKRNLGLLSLNSNEMIMTDPKQKAAMEILYRIFNECYFTGDNMLMVLATTRLVQKTMKYGLTELGGVAYSTLGISAMLFGYTDEAATIGETALKIISNFEGSPSESQTLTVVYTHVLPWTKLLQSCVDPLKQAYSSGMRSGNIENATWAVIIERIFLSFTMGKPLKSILAKCPGCATQAEELGQQDQVVWVKIFWQMMTNLAGESKETKLLKGDIFDCDEYAGTNPASDAIMKYIKMNLLVLFGDFEDSAEFALQVGDSFAKSLPANYQNMREVYLRGVALYAMAIKTRKRKYKKPAKSILKTLKTWLKKGNPNVKHYFSLLSAEQAVLDKDYDTAEKHYRDAIVLGARSGHLHDAALSTERYADFLRHGLKDKEEADVRLQEAIRYYTEWGAQAKVDLMVKA